MIRRDAYVEAAARIGRQESFGWVGNQGESRMVHCEISATTRQAKASISWYRAAGMHPTCNMPDCNAARSNTAR
jgi:hypothetical protein